MTGNPLFIILCSPAGLQLCLSAVWCGEGSGQWVFHRFLMKTAAAAVGKQVDQGAV